MFISQVKKQPLSCLMLAHGPRLAGGGIMTYMNPCSDFKLHGIGELQCHCRKTIKWNLVFSSLREEGRNHFSNQNYFGEKKKKLENYCASSKARKLTLQDFFFPSRWFEKSENKASRVSGRGDKVDD